MHPRTDCTQTQLSHTRCSPVFTLDAMNMGMGLYQQRTDLSELLSVSSRVRSGLLSDIEKSKTPAANLSLKKVDSRGVVLGVTSVTVVL